jgi:hypothetical protein
MLLHDVQRTRVLVRIGRAVRLTWLPASRDSSGALRVAQATFKHPADSPVELAEAIVAKISGQFPRTPTLDEILLYPKPPAEEEFGRALQERLHPVRLLEGAAGGVPPAAVAPAAVAVLGLLHVDQVPASTTALTGVRVPRVLGRLTPGSPQSWQRLVRELAAAKPSVIALRSAV